MYQHKNRIKNGIQISPYEWIFKTNFIIKQEIVWINGSQNFDKIRFYPFTERVYWLTKSPDTKLINTINKQDVFSRQEWKPVGTNKAHTRAFPERLVYDLISVFPDSKIIMDPFMGSGTVAYVAQELGKKFIGFELDKTFFDLFSRAIELESSILVVVLPIPPFLFETAILTVMLSSFFIYKKLIFLSLKNLMNY